MVYRTKWCRGKKNIKNKKTENINRVDEKQTELQDKGIKILKRGGRHKGNLPDQQLNELN